MNMRQLLIAVLLSTLAAAQPSAGPVAPPAPQDRDAEAGYQHIKRKQFISGAKRLSVASARDPENMQLRMDLAYAYQAAKKHAEAEAQFRIVASKPGDFQTAAAAAAEEIARQRSGAGEAKRRARLEQGYAAVSRGDKAAARRAFGALLAADPKDEDARKQMGYLNFEEGRYADAAADFEAALALRPDDHVTALQLGYTFEHLKKREKARASFTAALQSGDDKIREAAQNALRASSDGVSPAAPL